MASSPDVFALYHTTVAKLSNWSPGVPPPSLPKPGLFIGKVLELIVRLIFPIREGAADLASSFQARHESS